MTASTTKTLQFRLNREPVSVQDAGVQTTLLDVLRYRGLIGAKEGCAEGECGACMVVMLAPHSQGSEFRAVNSCLILAPMAAGHEIYTVEALAATGQLSDAQKAMAAAGGSQCGYCTPGFVISLFAEQYRRNRTGACDVEELAGNLCRCTGYRPIRDAAHSLGPPPPGDFLERLSQPAPQLEAIQYEPSNARFTRTVRLDDCLSLLAQEPNARVISGGTDLAVESNLRARRWSHLVSVEAIPELHEFTQTREFVRVGAALPLNDIAKLWSNAPAAFFQWLRLFASPPLRNRATLGGNLATASPIGDGAPQLLALDALVQVASERRRRTIPLASFFTTYRRTVLAPDELITAIEIPKPLPSFLRFYKVAKRRTDDISTVAAAFAMDWDGAGRIERARFAFGGVAAIPIRAFEVEEGVIGQRWNEATARQAQAVLDRILEPISDHRGSAEYRREVAKSLIAKFLWEWREATA